MPSNESALIMPRAARLEGNSGALFKVPLPTHSLHIVSLHVLNRGTEYMSISYVTTENSAVPLGKRLPDEYFNTLRQ